jgi:dihydropteroate synthase
MRVTRSPGLPRGFRLSAELTGPVGQRPVGIQSGATARAAIAADEAVPLAGGPLAFAAAEVLLHGADDSLATAVATLPAIRRWAKSEGGALRRFVERQIERMTAARAPFAGLALDRPRIVGIVNVTPDSFYDGGLHATVDGAIGHARALVAAGADMIDIGGESTRPGSAAVPAEVERDRVVPVVKALASDGVAVSVDTRRPMVMRDAAASGARAINDVTALSAPGAVEAVADAALCTVLMHMQGTPATMQNAPRYDHAPYEVYRFLESRIAACLAAGIPRQNIAVDPGIGFGKTLDHNLALIDSFALLHDLGCAVMAGLSRKSFVGGVLPGTPASDRLPGTLAATVLAAAQGVQLHRVHDAAEARQALAVWAAAANAG